MAVTAPSNSAESQLQWGVKHLHETGINKLPNKYILPFQDRPNHIGPGFSTVGLNLQLPVIDFAQLQGPTRSRVLNSISEACSQYGFFQVVNHGIPTDVIDSMIDVSSRFFELPFEERAKYMTSDIFSPVRYGTSQNQNKDTVFCWRDFLKLTCHPMSDILPRWPSSPPDLRKLAASYAGETKNLFLTLMEAILEGLGVVSATKTSGTEEKEDIENSSDSNIMKKLEQGSHLTVVNCYPPCPEPNLTLGMAPHSDYGFLTLLLQNEVAGLQIQYQDEWVTIEPIPGAFVVNVGDHLEIFSNGRYKSVLHRVVANSSTYRISVASLHSLPNECKVRPSRELIDDGANLRKYKDTDFESFLAYLSSCQPKKKNFLESMKLS